MRDKYQIAVVGGGMAGAAAALGLARQGWSVALIDAGNPTPVDPAEPLRTRVSTLSPASQNILRRLGAWPPELIDRVCPFEHMRVWEDDPARDLRFSAADAGLPCLGYVVENELIQSALWQALEGQSLARLYRGARVVEARQGERGVRLELNEGGTLSAGLLVAADGSASPLRGRFGFQIREWDYQQSGLVGPVETEAGHQDTAWQRFLSSGPLAFLPLADGGCSIVWSVPTERAEELMQASEEELAAALTQASQGRLGQIRCAGPRAMFPLKRLRTQRYFQERVVLIGDAAHVVHPLAGQGANLGLLDAAALAEVLEPLRQGDRLPADPLALREFERWRKSDNEIMAVALHAIKALYRLEAPPMAFGRRLGVDLLNRSAVLRARIISHASGFGGRVPLLARESPEFA